jgi:uncharacterized protein YndB with AHSA1/START domain
MTNLARSGTAGDAVAIVEGRTLTVTRFVGAPRNIVYEAWTEPQHLTHWWGPRGFTITIKSIDVRPGGSWVYMMHGPDGVDYPNKIVYSEVVRPERLVYVHSGDEDDNSSFDVTVDFTEDGGKTKITMQSVFPSVEALQYVVENYGAVEGGKQTMARLAEHLEQLEQR